MTEHLAVDDGTIAYEVHGSGPLLVLAHGLGDDRTAFRLLTPRLVEAGYRVAAVDLRGCGESSTDWPAWNRTAIAGDLIAVIRHLGGPAVIVGHSIAGGAAVIAAAQEPTLVTAVVGLGPVTRKPTLGLAEIRNSRFRKALTQLGMAMTLGSRKHWLSYLEMAYPGTKPADWAERVAHINTMLADTGRMKAFQKMSRNTPADAAAQLPNVHCPVLVVMGSADPDWADPKAEANGIVADLPAGLGTVEMIQGAGHYTHDQTPEQVTSAVIAFLDRIGAGA